MENVIPFDLKEYKSGKYVVVSRDGKDVIVAGVNYFAKQGYEVIGWLQFRVGETECYSWDLDGKLCGWKGKDYPHDLFLKLKQ